MHILSIIIFFIGVLTFTYFIFKEFQEIQFLQKTLVEINGKTTINTVQDLINIKNYLNKTITYNSDLKTKKRPLLRHTASQILKSNYGFCGENARVSIKLFLLGGIKASRIYLYGKKWGHVVIEHKWNNAWYLFDGHYDPLTKLENKDITAIESNDLSSYPNGYPENLYINYCRIKLFYMIKPLKFLSKIKLPSFVVYFFESPYLIKAYLAFVTIFVSVLLYYLTY